MTQNAVCELEISKQKLWGDKRTKSLEIIDGINQGDPLSSTILNYIPTQIRYAKSIRFVPAVLQSFATKWRISSLFLAAHLTNVLSLNLNEGVRKDLKLNSQPFTDYHNSPQTQIKLLFSQLIYLLYFVEILNLSLSSGNILIIWRDIWRLIVFPVTER